MWSTKVVTYTKDRTVRMLQIAVRHTPSVEIYSYSSSEKVLLDKLMVLFR